MPSITESAVLQTANTDVECQAGADVWSERCDNTMYVMTRLIQNLEEKNDILEVSQ